MAEREDRRNTLLNAEDVAQILGITPQSVYRMVFEERIDHIKLGSLVRFRYEDVEPLIGRYRRAG